MKVSIDQFYTWCAGANEDHLLCAKAKLLKEITAGEKMLWAVNKRLDYLDTINFENCTKRAKSLEIDSLMESD